MPIETKARSWLRTGTMVAMCIACACSKGRQTVVVADAAAPTPAAAGDAAFVPEEEVSARLQREMDTAAKLDPELARRVNIVRPLLSCVEQMPEKADDRATAKGKPAAGKSPAHGSGWRAHFGYVNPGKTNVSIPVGFYNRFWPPPIGQGQPTTFRSGIERDVIQIPFDGAASAAWVLGGSYQVAKATAPLCPTPSAPKNPARKRD